MKTTSKAIRMRSSIMSAERRSPDADMANELLPQRQASTRRYTTSFLPNCESLLSALGDIRTQLRLTRTDGVFGSLGPLATAAAAIAPIGDADRGLEETVVARTVAARKGLPGTWRKDPQRSLYTPPTNCTGTK